MKEKTKAYMAGLLDAEGSFYIGRFARPHGIISYNPDVRISSKHLPTIKWAVQNFGGTYYASRDGEYSWQYSSQIHAGRFLDLVIPYLVLKRLEAEVLRQYISLDGKPNPAVREKLFRECQRLKNRSSLTTNTPNFPITQKNLRNAYFAGFFDGDGWASITKAGRPDGGKQYQRFVALSQTDSGMAKHLKTVYGGTIDFRPAKPNCLPQYQWAVRSSQQQEIFLLSVIPYLIEKRERANLVLQMIRLGPAICPAKRESLWKKMRILNGKMIESDLHGRP